MSLFASRADFPCRGAEANATVQTLCRTTGIPQLHVYRVFYAPVMQVLRVLQVDISLS